MPNKSLEEKRRLKREWYVKNKDKILQQKRDRRAAQKKPKAPHPPKPAPTPEQVARSRLLNKEACQRYRATHLAQVRQINRDYYHRNREHVRQQQRDRRARDRQNRESPFRKLRALADVCAAKLIELDHGYTRIEPAPEKKTGPRKKQSESKNV